jgi:hypothetical protein
VTTNLDPKVMRWTSLAFHRIGILVLLLSVAGLGFAKCGDKTQREKDLVWAKDIATACAKAEPLVAQLNPEFAPTYHQLVVASQKVIAAVDASDAETAAQLLREMVPIINQTVALFTNNTKVLTILAIADIGIGVLLNHLPESPQASIPGQAGQIDVLVEYKNQRRWGCDYRPEKCK